MKKILISVSVHVLYTYSCIQYSLWLINCIINKGLSLLTVLRFTDNGNEKCGYYFPGSAYIKWLMYNYYALTGSDIIILKRYKRMNGKPRSKTSVARLMIIQYFYSMFIFVNNFISPSRALSNGDIQLIWL